MNKKLASTIIRALSFSGDTASSMRTLSGFAIPDWQSTYRWLDNTNLALYLLRRLEQEKATAVLPPPVLDRLQRNLARNSIRVGRMADEFRTINAEFANANLVCAVMKGFSLFPYSCPDPYLRQPSDLDYLIKQEDQPAAEALLFKLGYSLRSMTAQVWSYGKGALRPSLDSEKQYDPETPFVVELHLDIWDAGEHFISLPSLTDRTHPLRLQEWEGAVFRSLSEEDSFMLQIVHTVHHMFDGWTKLSLFYEIGHFLYSARGDTSLWERIETQSAGIKALQDFTAVVTQLAAQFFEAPVPDVVAQWTSQLSELAKYWIERYGKHFLFAKVPVYEFSLFPTVSFALLLQQELIQDKRTARRAVSNRLIPRANKTRAALRNVRQHPAVLLNKHWRQQQHTVRRILYFSTLWFRYLLELPRWHWVSAHPSHFAMATLHRRSSS